MLYLDIFTRGYVEQTPVTGVVIPSDINYLRRLYTFNRDSIEQYYLERMFSTKNTHILSRYLEHISPFLGYDIYRYMQYADDKATYLSKHFKFTSDIEKGTVHPPYFFGNQGEELILVHYELFDVKHFVANWKTEPAIKILHHPRNDLRLLLPLGNDNGCKAGVASILLNPIKLAIKYREFMRENLANEQAGKAVLTKNHFLMRHVLNLTVSDIADHSLLNRLMDTFYGREKVEPKFKHRFKIYEPQTQVDRYLQQTLDTISSKKLDFVNLLHNIQLPFSVDAGELLVLPELTGTRQSRWALVVSRLEHMCFMYDVCKSKEMNKHYLNDWKRLVTRIERDSQMFELFSHATMTRIKEQLYKIKQM